ncbi:hypothetical protein Droror1_Dr00006386 [Drosera rotundifolia]
MSATVISEPLILPSTQESAVTAVAASSAANAAASAHLSDIESAKCDCCGLTEDCTPAYIERIRERYLGKWICGLCAEAAKDEVVRSERLISTEEALTRHMNVCRKFRVPPHVDPVVDLIAAMRQILRRNRDQCPRGGLRSAPSSPMRAGRGPMLARTGSCFSTLSG